ncbi:MAG: hypothetical protein HND57_16540 [Planctomycetes bacterium]|nr:hypothetical protein [Planctomycetota bacterium]
MNITSFLKHWSIRENPFTAEEARQDEVFTRLHGDSAHPDFGKIMGDPGRPASSVVFGEKGSGKTALRLQLEEAIHAYNEEHPDNRALVIAYDELNPVLDRFARRVKGRQPLDSLQQLRLIDHIDGLLSVAVPDLVDNLLGKSGEGHAELPENARATARTMDRSVASDLLLLQALYDRPDQALDRSPLLRKVLRCRYIRGVRPLRRLCLALWILVVIAAAAYGIMFKNTISWPWLLALSGGLALTLVCTIKVTMDYFRLSHLAKLLSAQLRVLDRSQESFRRSLEILPQRLLVTTALPLDDLDDPRYAMLERLRRVIAPFGYRNIIVLIDRVDEPTLVNGETPRMKAVVWPLFNNKFLQQEHIAFKMMLPLELRHELYRQSAEFFQEARLDKQNMIDRLVWPGTMLYDLCTARMNACLDGAHEEPVSLTQLFDETVTRQDVVDALDQMRQPRDAFKLIYQVILEHCSSTTEEEANWRVPKLVLDQVRRGQVDRVEGLHRGLRPA